MCNSAVVHVICQGVHFLLTLHFVLQVGLNGKSFRFFMAKKCDTKAFAIPRLSDTRYGWRDIGALFVWKVCFL